MVPDVVVSAVGADVLSSVFIEDVLAGLVDAVLDLDELALDGDHEFLDWVEDGVEGEGEFAFLAEVDFFASDAVVDVALFAKTCFGVDHESVSAVWA